MFGNHGLCSLLEEGAHEKSPKCLCGNLGDFGEFCKGLNFYNTVKPHRSLNGDTPFEVLQAYFSQPVV